MIKKYDSLNVFLDSRVFNFEEPERLKLASNICILFRRLDSKTIKYELIEAQMDEDCN